MERLVPTVFPLLALAACGGDGSARPAPGPDAGAADAATGAANLITPVGAPTGTPVVQTIGVGGGQVSEPASGASVILRPGSFAEDVVVSLQPVQNLVPGGVGDAVGVEIQASGPQAKRTIVQLPYGDDVPDPTKLHVAMQADDGSWLALSPAHLDAAARRMVVALPLGQPAAARPAPARASTNRRVIAKWLDIFYLEPSTASVKVGQSLTLTPYAAAMVTTVDTSCANPIDDDCLPALPPAPVPAAVPFTNDKPGYIRVWYVNNLLEGDSVVGSIRPSATLGAVYTAPAKKPQAGVITVEFISTDQMTALDASADASIQIIDDCDPDPVTGTPPTGCDWLGHVTIDVEGAHSESENTTQPTCGYYFNCTHMMTYEHKISGKVDLRFAGPASGPGDVSIPATSVSGQGMETIDRMLHDTETTSSGCVYFNDEMEHSAATGTPEADPITGAFALLTTSASGPYLVSVSGFHLAPTGMTHTEMHSFDCVTGNHDGQGDTDFGGFEVAFANEMGTVDPENPKVRTGMAVHDVSFGDIDAKVTVHWEFTQP